MEIDQEVKIGEGVMPYGFMSVTIPIAQYGNVKVTLPNHLDIASNEELNKILQSNVNVLRDLFEEQMKPRPEKTDSNYIPCPECGKELLDSKYGKGQVYCSGYKDGCKFKAAVVDVIDLPLEEGAKVEDIATDYSIVKGESND